MFLTERAQKERKDRPGELPARILAESTVSCDLGSNEEMDNAAAKLGQGLWGVIYHVRGQNARMSGITKIPSHQGFTQQAAPKNALTGALDMPEFL